MVIDRANSLIMKKQVLCTNNISLMQHLDFEPVQTERPGELIAYYKIARKSIFLFSCDVFSIWKEYSIDTFIRSLQVGFRSAVLQA